MAAKKAHNRSKPKTRHRKQTKEPTAKAVANCVYPEDIMLCVLTRLPVKSLLRFRSVCRLWCKLIATPKFIKMHHDQLSGDPKNQSFILCSLSESDEHTMSLFTIDDQPGTEKKPTNLDRPCPLLYFKMDCVRCCNGLICMGVPMPPDPVHVILWNPALRFVKSVPSSDVDFGVPEKVSIGFGYDSDECDFKVVKIVYTEKKKGLGGLGVEVYSVNSDSWTTVEVDFQFNVLRTKDDVIVNGNPYWFAKVDDDEVLVCFDVKKLVFKIVPFWALDLKGEGKKVLLVEWKGCLGALVYAKNLLERVERVDAWVFDDGEKIWRHSLSFGPIEVDVDRLLHCSKDGKVIGECPDGMVFVCDPHTGCVEEIVVSDRTKPPSFGIHGYTESLALVGR